MSVANKSREGVGKTALITGASAGIGKAFAELLAEKGYDVILTARREERLQKLADELSDRWSIRTKIIVADLADPQAPLTIFESLKNQDESVDVLVNNAGYALKNSFSGADWREHADLIQVMGTSYAHLCHLLVPGMKERGFGRIINVSSLGAFAIEVPGSLYNGIKSFLVRMSQSLDLELRGTGVTCLALCPGFTYTEFHDVMGVRDDVNRMPKIMWMDARSVVEQGYRAAMKGKAYCIPGRFNRFMAAVITSLPLGIQYGLARSYAGTYARSIDAKG